MNSNVPNTSQVAATSTVGRAGPSYTEIYSGLKPADDPLAFIQANLGAAPVVAMPVPAPQAPAQVTHAAPQEQAPQPQQQATHQPAVSQQPVIEPAAQDTQQSEPEENLLDDIVNQHKPEESLRKMGKKIKIQEKLIADREAEAIELRSKIEKFEKGEEIPAPAKLRISELERYENLHSLKTSPHYTEKYLKPIAETRQKLHALAKDYELPNDIIERAATIESKRELNGYLREYFDDLGAIEARDLVNELRDRQLHAKQAEDSPRETLDTIREEIEHNSQVEEARRTNRIVESSRTGWTDALMALQADEKYPELAVRENDPEHNQYSQPIVNNAATEYGKFISYLAKAGIKELPKEIASILAKRFALSEAALVMSQSRQTHYNEAQRLLDSNRRDNKYSRPPVGGAVVNGPSKSPQPAAPQPGNRGLYTAADELLAKVGLR